MRSSDNINPDIRARQQYWQRQLEDMSLIKLSTIEADTSVGQQPYQSLPFDLDTDTVNTLHTAVPAHSLEDILLTCFYVLLQRYTGESDLTVGTACTAHNLLPLRLQSDYDIPFHEMLKSVANLSDAANSNNIDINQLSSVPTCNVQFVINNKYSDQHENLKQPRELALHISSNIDATIHGSIEFKSSLFAKSQIEALAGHFKNIITTLARNPTCKPSEVPLLLEHEVSLINQFNNTSHAPHFGDMLVPEALHDIAANTPEEIALVFHPSADAESVRWTYRELDHYTNQIANYLREDCALKQGDRIAISLTRSLNLPAFIIGVLKAGMVFVPFDTTDSNLFKLKVARSEAAFCVTDNMTERLFSDKTIRSINIDDESTNSQIRNKDTKFHKVDIDHESTAYIIDSSGTSGVLKSIVVPHRSMKNLMEALCNQGYPDRLSVLCTALSTFDAFLFDLLAAWANKGTVHITTDSERLSAEAFDRIVRNEKINFAVVLPAFMSKLSPDLPLEHIICMGEPAHGNTFNEWKQVNSNRTIENGYGPTECGVCTNTQEFLPGIAANLIGKPISNMRAFILDKHTHASTPLDVMNVIYIAGPGLASAYDNNEELSSSKFLTMKYHTGMQKFIPCDKNDPHAMTLYDTGDYGCYTACPDGSLSIKCIGRTDRTIKIYGVSINLDGVEASIRTHPDVKTAAVIAIKHGQDLATLMAFVIMKDDSMEEQDAKRMLREHMKSETNPKPVPTIAHPQFVVMSRIPETSNGKVDFKQLGAIAQTLVVDKQLQATHEDPVEKITRFLLDLWSELLATDSVDMDENTSFQHLGGTSGILPQLEFIINERMGLTGRNAICIGLGKDSLSISMTIHSLAEALALRMKAKLRAEQRQSQELKTNQNGELSPRLFHGHPKTGSLTEINPSIYRSNSHK